MKEYILFETKAFLFQRKKLAILGLWFLISLAVLGQILLLGEGNHEEEVYNELNDTRLVLRSVETYYRESDSEQTLADNLFIQQGLAATKYNGYIFEAPEWFYDAGIELAQLRLAADHYPDEEFPDSLFPSADQSERNLIEYQEMKEKELPLRKKSENLYDYTVKLLSIYGTLAFLFAMLLSANLGLRDLSHPSLVKSYPIQRNTRIIIQTAIHVLGGTLGLLMMTLLSFLIVQILWGGGDWLWPIAYYNQLSYQTSSLIQYFSFFTLYLFILMIHTASFSFLSNQLFKNQYVSLMIGALLYMAGFILSPALAWIRWLPLPYYHLDKVLTGFFAEQLHPGIDLTTALVTLFLWAFVFLFISSKLISPSTGKENDYA